VLNTVSQQAAAQYISPAFVAGDNDWPVVLRSVFVVTGQPNPLPIHCPVCRSAIVEMMADATNLKVYRCRLCSTSFIIVPPSAH